MKYRKGSMGAAEAKTYRVVNICLGAIAVLIFLLLFVIPGTLQREVADAPIWMNIVGGALVVASLGIIVAAENAGEEGTWGYTLLAIGMMVLAFFFSAGFFDNPHSYKLD